MGVGTIASFGVMLLALLRRENADLGAEPAQQYADLEDY
jgi:hypothetical protein